MSGDPARRRAFERGLAAEERAIAFYAARHFGCIARRARTKLGEIDLIMRNGDLLVFVEVKARASLNGAAFALAPRQMRRIAAAAEVWLAEHPQPPDTDMRFDVMLVSASGAIRQIENAFEAGA